MLAASASAAPTATEAENEAEANHFGVRRLFSLFEGNISAATESDQTDRCEASAGQRVEETPGPKHMLRMDTTPDAMWH